MNIREQLIQVRGGQFPTVYHMGNIDDPLASPDLRPATAIYKTADQDTLNAYQGLPALYNRELGQVDENLCGNCRSHGVFGFINGNQYCISGCTNCVHIEKKYHWGSLQGAEIPCNGSFMGRELSNLELIYVRMILRSLREGKSFNGLFQDLPSRLYYLMELLWGNIDTNNDENWDSAMWILKNELSLPFLNMIEENFDFTLTEPRETVKDVKDVKWYINFFNRRYNRRLIMANYSWDPREDPIPKLPKKILCLKLMDVVEDNQEKLSDGDYLKMMNLLRDLHLTQC